VLWGSTSLRRVLVTWCGGLLLTERQIEVLSLCLCIFDVGGSVRGCMCVYTHTHTQSAHWVLDVSRGVGMRHLEDPKNLDGLNLGKYVFIQLYKVHTCIYML